MTATMREMLRRLAPLAGKQRVDQWWQLYLASDYKQRQELEQCIALHTTKVLQDSPLYPPAGLFPPPPKNVCAGEIPLGNVTYGGRTLYPIGLRRNELLRHIGIYGSSGAGKSNGLALILDGLTNLGVPWWLVDFKRTFRALIRSPGYEDLLVFTAGDANTALFAFNPLIPPRGTSTDVWSKRITGLVSHAFMQGAGSESLLITALQEAYATTAQQGRWPTFKDVRESLEATPARGRRSLWMDSARRAMRSLTSGNAADVFCSENPIDLAQLLNRSLVCEIELLNVAEATFLSEAVLVFVLQHHMHNNRNREELVHALFIEEAHHLLRGPPGGGDGSEPVIHRLLREVRELGIAVCLASQDSSMVPLPVFGNQATTLAFHTKHQRDVMSTAQAMLLKEDARDQLGRLPVGEALIRIPRYHEPIHVALNYRPIAKGSVTDTDLAQHMANNWNSTQQDPYLSTQPNLPAIPAVPPTDNKKSTLPESAIPQETQPSTLAASPPPATQQTPKSGLSDLARLMLRDLFEHPFSGVVERIKRLGLSRRKATALLRALEEQGLVRPAHISTGQANLKLFDLTNEGIRLGEALELGTPPPPTEGGVLHRYIVQRVANTLEENGWDVNVEYSVASDLVVDVHAKREDALRAVLVETGKSAFIKNVKRTSDAGYEDIIIVTPTPDVAATIKRRLSAQDLQHIPVISLAAFLAAPHH